MRTKYDKHNLNCSFLKADLNVLIKLSNWIEIYLLISAVLNYINFLHKLNPTGHAAEPGSAGHFLL